MKHYVYAKRPIKQTDTNRKRPIMRLFQETWWRRAPLNMSKDWKDRIAPLVTWKRCPTVCVFVSLRFCVRMSWCLGVVCLCVQVSMCLCVFVSVCLYVFVSVCLFACVSVSLFVCVSVCLVLFYTWRRSRRLGDVTWFARRWSPQSMRVYMDVGIYA